MLDSPITALAAVGGHPDRESRQGQRQGKMVCSLSAIAVAVGGHPDRESRQGQRQGKRSSRCRQSLSLSALRGRGEPE